MKPTVFLLLACFRPALSVRVVGTDPTQLAGLEVHAEILNSDLSEVEELTVCIRLRTHQFSSPSMSGYQTWISLEEFGLAGSYSALPCDVMYPGCTEYQADCSTLIGPDPSSLSSDWLIGIIMLRGQLS